MTGENGRDLAVEVTALVGEIYPAALHGDAAAIGLVSASIADVLGGIFALIRRSAPNEITARAAMRISIERALQAAETFEARAAEMRAES